MEDINVRQATMLLKVWNRVVVKLNKFVNIILEVTKSLAGVSIFIGL